MGTRTDGKWGRQGSFAPAQGKEVFVSTMTPVTPSSPVKEATPVGRATSGIREGARTLALIDRSPCMDLIGAAQLSLEQASMAHTPQERYSAAHVAALRAAAAVIAAVAPRGSSGRIRSAWIVLAEVCPPLSEWAEFFAAGARTRTAAEAGVPCVSSRAADDLVREAEMFVTRVCDVLELAYQPAAASRLRAVK